MFEADHTTEWRQPKNSNLQLNKKSKAKTPASTLLFKWATTDQFWRSHLLYHNKRLVIDKLRVQHAFAKHKY